MSNCFIILAAGKSNRFISKIPKPYIRYKGDILINHSINKAILSKKFSKIVVAINKGHKKYLKKLNRNNIHYIETEYKNDIKSIEVSDVYNFICQKLG